MTLNNMFVHKYDKNVLYPDKGNLYVIANNTYNWENFIDPDGKLLWVNSGVERYSGYTPEECYAMTDFPIGIVFPEDRPEAARHFAVSLAGAGNRMLECRILRKDGAVRWMEIYLQEVNGADGVSIGHRSSLRDITQRKQVEISLRQSERTFSALFNSTTDAVMLLDEKGFGDCNPAALVIFGCATLAELCSKHLSDLSPLTQPCGTNSRILARQRIATAKKNGSLRFDWEYRRADTGKCFPSEVILIALSLCGKPMLQVVVRDLTERKQR